MIATQFGQIAPSIMPLDANAQLVLYSALMEFQVFGERRSGVEITVPGTYATLALALAGSEVAAATVSSRVTIRLGPGTYNASFDLDAHYFVDIRGAGAAVTTLNLVGDAVDTGNWGGGDAVVYDLTLNHDGPNHRAGHKDNNFDSSKLTVSRGGAVRCILNGLGKSAFGGRCYGNQEFWLIDCQLSTDTTEAIYLNNKDGQSAICRWYLINVQAVSSAGPALTIYSNNSGQKDTVTIIGGRYQGADGYDSILLANGAGGQGEFTVYVDSTCAYKTIGNAVGTGTLYERTIGPLFNVDSLPANYPTLKTQELDLAAAASSTTFVKLVALTDTYGVRFRISVWSIAENAYITNSDIDPYDGRTFVRRILQANGGFRISSAAPASSSASGEAGMLAWDTTYFYVCTASNTWKRIALSAY